MYIHAVGSSIYFDVLWSVSVALGVLYNSQPALNEICHSNLFSYQIITASPSSKNINFVWHWTGTCTSNFGYSEIYGFHGDDDGLLGCDAM
jgi:hypothetical protein